VKDRAGLSLAYVCLEEEPGRRAAAKLLTRDEARRIAAEHRQDAGTVAQLRIKRAKVIVMTNTAGIKAQLLGRQYRAEEIPAVDSAGIYAFHLTTPSALPGVSIELPGIIYLGMTDSSLEVRNHFTHKHSGFSTLRRSLGALLKTSLALQAIRRGSGPSRINVQNYRFRDADERRLTEWMTANLTYGFAIVDHDASAVERALIAELRPPLNLTHWPNPQRRPLRALRDVCRQEARGNA
jgi:hypothetical protein